MDYPNRPRFGTRNLRISSAVHPPESDPGDIGSVVYGQSPQAWQATQATESLVWWGQAGGIDYTAYRGKYHMMDLVGCKQ